MKNKILPIVALVAMLISENAYSQNGFYNVGKVTFSANTNIHIVGNLKNEGDINNKEGKIVLNGHWDNSGTYNKNISPKDEIELVSDEETIFKGKQSIATLSIKSGNTVRVEDSTVIFSKLKLAGNKNLLVKPESRLILRNGASIENASATSFIDGQLFREGTGNITFPIGIENKYMPVKLESLVGQNLIVGFEAFDEELQSSNVNVHLSDEGYWKKEVLKGNLESGLIELSFDAGLQISGTSDVNKFSIFETELSETNNFINLKQKSSEPSGKIASSISISKINSIYAIGIEKLKPFYLPNTLILSDDNQENRVIKVYGNELLADDFFFIILDKWGIEVFSETSRDRMNETGWSGKMKNGETLESGTYHYVLKAKKKVDNEIINFEKNGSILLIR